MQDHMRSGRHAGAAGAAGASIPELKRLSPKNKAVRKRLGDLLGRQNPGSSLALAGKERMDGVMEIVTPDCVKPKASSIDGAHNVGIVLVGFSNDTNLAAKFGSQRRDIGFDFRPEYVLLNRP